MLQQKIHFSRLSVTGWVLLFCLFTTLVYAADTTPPGQPSVSIKTYKIESIAFGGYQTISDISKILIIFCAYGEKAKVVYPAPQENIICKVDAIIKNCNEAFLQNIDKIIKIQAENVSVNSYLTFGGKIPARSKDDFKTIVISPQEKTVQRDPATNETIAEFRSKEFQIGDNTAFCIYVTFVCSQDKGVVEKIIISAVKLES